MDAINPARIQYLAVAGSLLFLILVFELVRKKKIREEYSLLWIFFGLVFLGVSLWRHGLDLLSRLVGIYYAPMAFLLLLMMAVFLILIQFSVVISRLKDENKKLIQRLALLELERKRPKNNDQDAPPG
jgi:hypothetical protein